MTDAGGSGAKRLPWQVAEVRQVVVETPRVKTFVLSVPGWPGHVPGQHVEVRLTGDDGSQAQRTYSIASEPEAPHVVLTIERIEEGEVSPYLVGDVQPGDRFELRGPIGGYFVWTVKQGGPLFLIAGGSGVVPLMAMVRHRAAAQSTLPAVLLYSSRTFEDIIYREELDMLAAKRDGLEVVHTLTRARPAGWAGETAGSTARCSARPASRRAPGRGSSSAARRAWSNRPRSSCWTSATNLAGSRPSDLDRRGVEG